MPSESYIEGNPAASTVICTFWTLAKPIAQTVPSDKFAVCANLYSTDGINTIIRAIWSNPHWRVLVGYGADLTHTGDILAAFFAHGLDEKGKVVGTNFSFQSEIPRVDLELIREHVKFHDLRAKPASELNTFVSAQPVLPAFAPAKEFPQPQPPAFQTFPSEKVGFAIRAPSVSHGWLQIVDHIMKFGVEKPTEYGNQMKEVLNMLAIIEGDDESWPEFLPFDAQGLEDYIPKLLSGDKPENVVYTYGSRLRKPIDQLKEAIEYLKTNPETRRAIAVTWRPEEDLRINKSPPCLNLITWNVANGKLNQTNVFRSHDMFEGWPLNMAGLREMQKHVSAEIGIPPGALTCLSVSAHIYDGKWEEAKTILQKYYTPSRYQFDPDPRGNFVINVVPGKEPDSKTIAVQHFTFDGQKTKFVFHPSQTTNEKQMLEELFTQLAHSNLISRTDHAFYLGAELHKALTAIRQGKEYTQDRELPH